ncbi:MAG TPA: hypothetical protein VEV81_00490 [Pyrinomonadaceae bacterium]|nr:hypothetical protein [Pyrinomonadaceae bacterium]
MRCRLIIAWAAFFMTAALVVPALTSSAAGPKSMTVFDYYLAMPQKYLRYAGGDSAAARNAALYIRDIENGYLQAREPAGEFYSSVALFKKLDGTDLVAVENRECARGCNEEFYLLTYHNGQWADVTAKMLPALNDAEVRASLDQRVKARAGFAPHILHKLSTGDGPIDVSEYWSGVSLGRLEWINGEFVFKPLASESAHAARNVLASVNNQQGDRLEIIRVEPELSNRLPLKGRLNVRIAYELHSARACRIWSRPVVLEERLPDEFTHGSMLYLQGSGELNTWFGFDNQAHLQQFRVDMVDDEKKPLLTLHYRFEADWEGVLECPTFHVECFPNDASAGAPLACMVYPSGVRPDQNLTYEWKVSKGTIMTGQGTRRIILTTSSTEAQEVTATVEVGGLPLQCPAKVSSAAPPGSSPVK